MYFSNNELSIYEVLSDQNNKLDDSYRYRVLNDRQLLLVELFDAADTNTQNKVLKTLGLLRGSVN